MPDDGHVLLLLRHSNGNPVQHEQRAIAGVIAGSKLRRSAAWVQPMDARRIPFAGIMLATACCVILIFAGMPLGLALGVAFVWIISFWLVVPPSPEIREERPEGVQLTQSGLRDLIEHSSLPLMLVDTSRIIMANANAREAIGAHIIGQDPRVALRHPMAVDLLSRPEGGTVTVQGLTGPRSNWQMSLQQIDERYSLIELINRTAEADVGRAHTDFVANASHELRTPLASIIGYMETLAEEGANVPPKQVERFYSTVLREARRLQTLVDDLMSLSRVEAGASTATARPSRRSTPRPGRTWPAGHAGGTRWRGSRALRAGEIRSSRKLDRGAGRLPPA